MNSIKLLTGNSHPQLAKLVADRYAINLSSDSNPVVAKCYHIWMLFLIYFSLSLGIELTKILVLQYSNQETSVTIGESVRDEDGMMDEQDTKEGCGNIKN